MQITSQSDSPARFETAVVFACDGVYARYAMLAAHQIAALHPDRDFDICLCSSEDRLSVPATLAGDGLRTLHVETPGVFDGLRLDRGRTPVVYLRLALPRALATAYRRILYLDADIFVQGGDFSALLGLDLGPHVIGAVRDNSQWRTPGRRPEQFKRLGLPAAKYFNAGVMLIDVRGFEDADVLGRCVALGRQNRDRMIRHDQNLLNSVLRGDWAELSPVWNWQYTRASALFEPLTDVHVIHFIGPRKPWSTRKAGYPPRFRRAYREFFERHLPGAVPPAPDPPGPLSDPVYLRRMLQRHYLAAGPMAAYLARFADPLDVKLPAEARR